MNKILVFICLFCGCLFACNADKTSEPIALFTEGADDWIEQGDADWSYNGGVITGVANDQTGFLVTTDQYDDFELTLSFNPDSTINSGIFVRCPGTEISAINCHELNIWDLHPNQSNRTGAIVTKQEPLAMVHTLNKWNTYKIRCIAGSITVWVNDTLTADYQDDNLLSGLIAIQAGGNGKIQFRDVRISAL